MGTKPTGKKSIRAKFFIETFCATLFLLTLQAFDLIQFNDFSFRGYTPNSFILFLIALVVFIIVDFIIVKIARFLNWIMGFTPLNEVDKNNMSGETRALIFTALAAAAIIPVAVTEMLGIYNADFSIGYFVIFFICYLGIGTRLYEEKDET